MDQQQQQTQSDMNQDELIMQQQKNIEKEICEQFSLISEKMPVESLYSEYADDLVYKTKVSEICKKYKHLRKVRPDGNW